VFCFIEIYKEAQTLFSSPDGNENPDVDWHEEIRLKIASCLAMPDCNVQRDQTCIEMPTICASKKLIVLCNKILS
jgi:hypothetical protein